jgi:perosamine synthetase
MAVTDSAKFAEKMRMFRGHGITTDYRQREEKGGHYYEMVELGFNYRITDFQCALGISQLKKLPNWIKRRQEIAAIYDAAFANFAEITHLRTSQDVSSAYHLYVIRLANNIDRDSVFRELRRNGIGVNVHYIPVHMHPYYKKLHAEQNIDVKCEIAEEAYEHIISIPMFPAMTDKDVEEVIKCLNAEVKKD